MILHQLYLPLPPVKLLLFLSTPQPQRTLPLSELLPRIKAVLVSCPSSECLHEISSALQHLSPADISNLLAELQGASASNKLVVINGLVQNRLTGDALSAWVSPEEEEEVVKRILMYLATGRIMPTRCVS